MKKLITICLLATMCMVDTSAQSIENEVINTIMARRSVRKYLDKPVEHAKLEAVVHCGINAPSGMNRQPWIVRLEIPEDYQLNYIIAIGYPDEQPEAKPRDESKVKYIK